MSDIVFDNTEQVTVLCDNLKVQGHDFLLDSPVRRKTGVTGLRRAVVHDQNDGLTINYNSDYPGGVTILGVKTLDVVGDIHIRTMHVDPTKVRPVMETVTLSQLIGSLRQEIADLRAQVTALAAKG